MAIDWTAKLHNPRYTRIGVAAVLDPGSSDPTDLTVLDYTGTDQQNMPSGMLVDMTKPAACVRMKELAAKSKTPALVDGHLISFSGKTWRVKSVAVLTSPAGEADGELLMRVIKEGA